jgi:predicted DNA binding CopG/RHH family protein
MNIHQLSVNYVAEQDRILTRINTTQEEELRLWFTRKLMAGLMPLMRKTVADIIAKSETIRSPQTTSLITADAQTKQLLADFKKDETIKKSNFATPFKEAAVTLPLGAEPLLVTTINLSGLTDGKLQMVFTEKVSATDKPRGFQVALDQSLVHGFMHLLDLAIAKSQWFDGSPAQIPSKENSANHMLGDTDRPKYLN